MQRLVKVFAIVALLFPFVSAAECAAGSCPNEQDELSLLQLKNLVRHGAERSPKELEEEDMPSSSNVSHLTHSHGVLPSMRTPAMEAARLAPFNACPCFACALNSFGGVFGSTNFECIHTTFGYSPNAMARDGVSWGLPIPELACEPGPSSVSGFDGMLSFSKCPYAATQSYQQTHDLPQISKDSLLYSTSDAVEAACSHLQSEGIKNAETQQICPVHLWAGN